MCLPEKKGSYENGRQCYRISTIFLLLPTQSTTSKQNTSLTLKTAASAEKVVHSGRASAAASFISNLMRLSEWVSQLLFSVSSMINGGHQMRLSKSKKKKLLLPLPTSERQKVLLLLHHHSQFLLLLCSWLMSAQWFCCCCCCRVIASH